VDGSLRRGVSRDRGANGADVVVLAVFAAGNGNDDIGEVEGKEEEVSSLSLSLIWSLFLTLSPLSLTLLCSPPSLLLSYALLSLSLMLSLLCSPLFLACAHSLFITVLPEQLC